MASNSHPNRRRKLKRILPIAAVILIGIIVFWPTIHKLLTPPPPPKIVSTIAQETLEKPNQSITNEARNLHFDGVDKNNQPYTLTAKEGTEFKEGTLELKKPELVIHLSSGQTVTLTANKAIFHKEQQKIELIDNVVLTHTTGFKFKTEKAWIDMTTSTAFGHDPITGTGPQGHIFAKGGFSLAKNGEKVSFIGRPELHITREAKTNG